MSPVAMHRLDEKRPAIKREWERLLRGEPPASALGHPDLLVHLMDSTLDQLQLGLHSRSARWLKDSSTALDPLRPTCRCTLNPLLNYYSTGELALHAVLGREPPPELERILNVFHLLAQEEVQLLCGACQHRGEPYCGLPPPITSG